MIWGLRSFQVDELLKLADERVGLAKALIRATAPKAKAAPKAAAAKDSPKDSETPEGCTA